MNQTAKDAVLEAYFRDRLEPGQIALMLGMSEEDVLTAINDPQRLEPYRLRAEAARLRAQICLYENAEAAARKQAQWLMEGEASGVSAASQRAAKEILDRTGVRSEKEERREVILRLAGDVPALGMPCRGKGGEGG